MENSADFRCQVAEVAHRLTTDGVCVLGALFDLTAQRLVRLAVAITRHQPDAEDAVQTALVKVARAPHRLAAADCPWAYLLRMVRNEALMIARRKQRWFSAPTGTVELSDLTTYCKVDRLEQEESFRAALAALRTLPAEQAEVVVLKIWEGLTFAQIGELLDISLHTAASRYQYALAKLARRLSPHNPVESVKAPVEKESSRHG